LLNGSFTLGTFYDEIDITTAKNYSYSYVDYLTSTIITNLLNQSYSYTSTNQYDPSGQGTLFYTSSMGLYVLDLDTETKSNGTYTIIIVLGKENYTTQITTLVLKIVTDVALIPVELDVLNYTTNIEFPVYTIAKYWNITFSLTLRFTEFNTGLPISDAAVSFSWEYGSGKVLPDNLKGPGYYSFLFNTGNASDIGTCNINFIAIKQYYSIGTPTPSFIINIIDRPTELDSSRRVLYVNQKLYMKDSYNFTFEYIDILTSQSIANAEELSFILQKLDNDGNLIEEGTILGFLYETVDNKYVLDLNTEKLREGDYSVIVSIKKKNYDLRIAIISLTMSKREFGAEFSIGQVVRIASGGALQIQITLIDPHNNSVPIVGATIYLILKDVRYDFTDNEDGTYSIRIPDVANAFISPKTIVAQGYIEKANFTTESFSITTVVEMEEILPGIPFFYFILVLSAIVVFSASIAAYKVYKYATIPEFVKKARAMKKAIEKEKSISESLLYQNKEAFIGERVKYKWDKIGLSLGEILGVKIEKETIKRRISEDVKVREFRPSGLLLMRWNERVGTEILTKYPEDLVATDKTLMQIYGTHEYSGERGIITLTVGTSNILSYYTGPEQSIYLLLFLNIDDDPDVYETGMSDIIQIILENYEDESYLQMIPSLFQRLSVYPSLSEEEILAITYENEIKRMIINNLRDYGVFTKSELMIWLKEVSVKGVPSELIILTNDLFMLRVPPVKLLDNPVERGLPTQFSKEYSSNVKKFFQNYQPSQEDNLKVLEVFINPQVYETLRLLRTAIVTKQDLEKLRRKGVEDINTVLNLLWNNQMIIVFQDKNKIEYYALISDFYLDIIFPKYILKAVKAAYEQKSKANKVLINYLDVLEDTYFDLKKRDKLIE
jgi:hypothetical protein